MLKLKNKKNENIKVKKEKRRLDDNQKMKLIKRVVIICFIIIALELIIMLGTYIFRENNIDYRDGLNDIKAINGGYIGAGSSNFRNSKDVSKKIYTHTIVETGEQEKIIANQAKIVKYDSDMNIVWERTFPCDYDSVFYNVLPVSDGYVAVGSYVYEYEQLNLETRDGLIVKYDLNGNMLWSKNYQVLGDTEFYKIIESDGNYIVVGQSIYENMELGNHATGGGIIVKYDKNGEVLAKNNYGGNKSGLFNDIVEVEDGYIVCGRDAANYGIIIKFAKDFNREDADTVFISKKVIWNTTYPSDKLSFTDSAGFTDLEIINNKIYVTSAINVSEEKDDKENLISQHDACLLVFDMKGKFEKKYTFGGSGLDRYDGMIVDDNSIIVIGTTESNDIEIEGYHKMNNKTAIMVKYDLEGNILEKKYCGEKNNTIFTRIIKIDDNKNLVVGTTNAIRGLFGYDYQSITNFYDNKLNLLDK